MSKVLIFLAESVDKKKLYLRANALQNLELLLYIIFLLEM